MAKGTVKWFDRKKGFGFIINEQGKDVFVHYSSIEVDGFKSLEEGQEVEYSLLESPKGLQGKEVKILTSSPQSSEELELEDA